MSKSFLPASGFPLQWPAGISRTRPSSRAAGNFSQAGHTQLPMTEALGRVAAELRFIARSSVVSTDVPVKRDGLPYANARKPDDPGAAVYWVDHKSAEHCMAIDAYTRVEQNLAAIAACLSSLRTLKRHGGASIAGQAYSGFKALPPGDGGAGKEPTLEEAISRLRRHAPPGVDAGQIRHASEASEACYRRGVKVCHPDAGGNANDFARLSAAVRVVRAHQAGGDA